MSSFKKHFLSLQKQQHQDELLPVPSSEHLHKRTSHEFDRTSGSMKQNYRHSNGSDGQMRDVDVLSFKSDIFNCLDMCTAYIQALNTLCSTGSVLAQNLTQVFSRDVNVEGDVIVGKSGATRRTANSGCRRFLRLKGPRREGTQQNLISPDDELDSNYFEVAEQFLNVWHSLSVSTAGASATIKTETLMTLQDILNNLEQENSSDLRSKSDLGSNLNLEKSIRAAKSCLLAYIELQAQFSYNSWKSLNHLSKVLKSDPTMTEVVGNVDKHFSSKCSDPRDEYTILKPTEINDQEKKIKKKATQNGTNSLDSAISLLSMGTSVSKKEHKRNRNHKDSKEIPVLKTVCSQLGKQPSQFNRECDLAPPESDNSPTIKLSTWPGKDVVTSVKSNEFVRTSEDWSMWPKYTNSDLQARSNDLFSGAKEDKSFLLPWNNFSTNSSSNPTMNGSSPHPLQLMEKSGLNMTVTNNSFEPFGQKGTAKMSNGFLDTSLRQTFNGPLNNILNDQTNLSVIELAKKLSLSGDIDKNNFGFNNSSSGYTFSTDPFSSVDTAQLPALDISRTSKTSTWPMKQVNNNDNSNNWSTFDTPIAFDSSNSSALFGSDLLASNYQGSSSIWPYDKEANQTPKVPTSFDNLFINEANNNVGHLNHNFG